ncbi:MAG: sulfate transporter CysZ [Acidiferrobacterales bacterium]
MLSDLLIGPRYLLRGFRLILRRGLRRFLLIPLFINVVVFAGLIWLGASQFEALVTWLLPGGESWWALLARGLLWMFFALTAGLLMFFTFTLVANLIGAPFNALLAERVEESLGGTTAGDSTQTWVGSLLRSIANELRKLRYFFVLILFALAVTIIPIANILAPFVWIMVTSWMLALEYLAYPMENHGFAFADVRQSARVNKLSTLGFGAAVMVVTLIPVVNLTVMPASVAGATAMWFERVQRQGEGR